MLRMGRPDLADDPDLARNDGRAARADEIDAAINAWTGTLSIDDVLAALHEADVPGGRIYTVADIAADPHYRARGVIETVRAQSGIDVDMPGVVPKLSGTPGAVQASAPRLGQHTREVLRRHGLTDTQIDALASQGVIADAAK